MKYTLVFHQLALDEVQDAYNWYEAQRSGLGVEFMDATDDVIQRILSNPASFPKAYLERRKALPSRSLSRNF